MPGVDNYPGIAQALEPGAQQRGGLHVARKHPAGCPHEGVDAQAVDPCAQRVCIEAVEQARDVVFAFCIARDERGVGFGMGDVHAAHARQQEHHP
uniref:N-acetyltransferase domain-containing protein n=1 Tax=Steinernema glaseri TaxID=37863 RepID=A0A1I8APJ5_9BILA